MGGPGLVLASRSPQRRAILEQLGIAFEVVVPDVDEVEVGEPAAVARENARRKACAAPADGRRVLGVDTVVALDGEVYGKPRDEAHARAMLAALSGREHRVVSGLAISRGAVVEVTDATTIVRFREAANLLDWYVATGEWRERAGGYAIQGRGAALVREIAGDYLNVVGLPVAALLDLWPSVLSGAR